MAVYVVLELEDEKDVTFLQQTYEWPIVGVFKKPTLFHDPALHQNRTSKSELSFTRGKKYGWWVCATCKRPTTGWGQNVQAVISSGVNLANEYLRQTQQQVSE